MNEDRYAPTEWPTWAFAVSLALMSVLALTMVVTAARPAIIAPLAVTAVLPWGLHLAGRHPPVGWFLTLSIVPLVLVNTVAVQAAGDAALLSVCMAVYIQGESVAAYRPRDAVLGVLAGGLVLALHAWVPEERLSDFVGAPVPVPAAYLVGATAGAITIGYLLRRQQQTVVELRSAQDRLVGEAALQERQRIAREVHDVVAHSLTVTMMHVTAARMAIRRDPGSAIDALEEAERLGRQSLDEIRRTVALLRDGGERATAPALPAATDLHALVAQYAGAGVDVDLDVHGPLADLEAATGLALFRLVQEAIGNAVKHAPGAPVTVRVGVSEDAVDVQASNPLPTTVVARRGERAGLGLVGMRERIALLGGTIAVGPQGRAWVVDATLPRSGAPDAGASSEPGWWCR